MTIRPLPILLSAAFLAGAAAGGLAALAAQSEAEPDLATQSAGLAKEAADAKHRKDVKDAEKLTDR